MKNQKNRLLFALLFSLGFFGLLIYGSSAPNANRQQSNSRLVSQNLELEMKWMLAPEQSDFATVQDTLSFYAEQLAALNFPIQWEIDHCCGENALTKSFTGGPEAYQFSMKIGFTNENARKATLEAIEKQGFLQTQTKRNNHWEVEGLANISLPIPNQNGKMLEIHQAAIMMRAASGFASPFPVS